MRYAQIRECDVSNGEGIGVALFVQGCHFHCKSCFNPETWDFDSGKEWTQDIKEKFLELANRPYIKRISILGGEPLADENINDVLDLVNETRLSLPQKSIWLYTGYKVIGISDGFWELEPNVITDKILDSDKLVKEINDAKKRSDIIRQCDVLVDGQYIDSLQDITLPWRGSANQRVINIKESLQKRKIILWDNQQGE
ncbi:MAG: 4Fe-4S cluster-binding domain-containing protein [Lachnospiraceae bacterium]|nr:4Fe-4S cluster-binding domain-containing protein [Lachnospiraceae bacterium]